MAVKRRIPKDRPGQIRFCKAHVSQWKKCAAEIGTTLEMVETLEELTDLARVARAEQRRAINAARSATAVYHQITAKMAWHAGSIIGQIDTYARKEGKKVYPKAWIDAPNRRRTRIGPPGKPEKITHALLPLGWIQLKWTCKHPPGSQHTQFQIWRRVGVDGKLVFLGHTPEKTFVDETLPAGSARVEYDVQAVRGKTKGEAATHVVFLGTNQKRPRSMQFRKQFPPLAA